MTDSKEFYDKLRGNKKPPQNGQNGQEPPPAPPDSDPPSWVLRELARKIDEFAAMPANSGRNAQLNNLACEFGRLPVSETQLSSALLAACQSNGLLAEDGLRQCNATIDSGLTKARQDGPKTTFTEAPPHVENVNWEFFTGESSDETDDGDGGEKQDLHALAVGRRAYELRINDEARALWTRQRANLSGQQRPELVNLVDLLAEPDEDATYRIDEVFPTGGRALLAAQYKAGKTSMMGNLIRSLVDGDPFLATYHTEKVGRVVLVDTELDKRMLRRWIRDHGIRNSGAVDVICLRGKLTTFNIVDETIRAEWAALLRGAEFLILDCIRPCLDAIGLSEDKEAGIFLTAFDALCMEAGIHEACVVHHMGHGSERSRGDSRLLDWPDVIWKIIRDTEDDESEGGDRFFSALGRDVKVGEAQLDWNEETRAISICGGGRSDKRARSAVDDIVEIMSRPDNNNGISQNQLELKLRAAGVGRNVARKAIAQAIKNAVILVTEGQRFSLLFLNPSRRTG
jgi:hypothetical protein